MSADAFEAMRRRALPELGAGGFSRLDGTIEFHHRVNTLLRPDSVVVDFGAGRGRFLEEPLAVHREIQDRKHQVARLIGLDVDAVVTENPAMDEAHVINVGEPLPLPSASADVVVSDYAFEHIDDPVWAAAELTRIVRPGGWICARTPNRWGLIALPARMVPNRLHDAVLARVQPTKQTRDTFPTRYRLNTPTALRRHFSTAVFDHCSYTHECEPSYVGRSRAAWTVFRAAAAVTPAPLRSIHMIFMRKREDRS